MVFVTNVVLSPVSESGGVDTVDREIRRLRDELGLSFEDWRVWHRDTLGSFLDVHVDVRRTYAGQITTGDILACLMAMLEGSGFQGVGELATSYAVMEMTADQWVRLDQAGEGNNQALPLARVGVDLAATVEDAKPGRRHVQVLRHVLAQGDRHEFAPERFEHLQVTPLGTVDALAYAERLVAVRFPGAPVVARKVLDRLGTRRGSR
jgi:hypothetical protein